MNSKLNIPKAFFSFFIASFFMWILINLSKEYTTILSYKISYKKIAQNKILQETPLQEIMVKVTASGFRLFVTNFSNRALNLNADKLQKKGVSSYYFLPSKQKKEIQGQLHSGLRLEEILKDTLFLNLGSLALKKVPVLTKLTIDFNLGYDLLSPIEVVPDSVVISGSESQLKNIQNVYTEAVTLEDVFEDQQKELKIDKSSALAKIKLSHDKVKATIKVDKFTEGEFSIPFTVKNVPKGTEINTYPQKVKVIFKVGLNNFNKISKKSFEVICDYKESKEKELSYLVPKLEASSGLVSSVRILPNKVDFLIQK